MRGVLFLVLSLMAMATMAQTQVDTTAEAFATYNRQSMAVVWVDYGDQWDRVVNKLGETIQQDKFDRNDIPTQHIRWKGTTRVSPKTFNQVIGALTDMSSLTNMLTAEQPARVTEEKVSHYLNEHHVGREMMAYILMRDADGRFHRDILDQRNRWNATDQDVMDDAFAQVDRMGQNDVSILCNSYIMVVDVHVPQKERTERGKDIWTVEMTAYTYEMANAEAVANTLLSNMWIHDHDDAATRAAKKAAFDKMHIPMKLVSTQKAKESDYSLDLALLGAYQNVISKLENKISTWQTTANCETVRPYITAKIGTKEGLRNGQRFAIYGQKWDKQKGRGVFKRLGYARVTEVADNSHVADGQTDSTYLYQIAGGRLKGDYTEIIKQSNDARLGVHVGYNYNMIGSGSFSMVDVGVDYLAHIHKNGICHYAVLNLGYDWRSTSFLNLSVGYQLGLKVKQIAEVQPYLKVGVDMLLKKNSNPCSCFIDPGVRLVVNCCYPFQVFVQANYSVNINQEQEYREENERMMALGSGHTHGLGLGCGVVVRL